MRILQVVPGYPPQSDKRDNIFIHRQIQSLTPFLPEMQVVYAGLGSRPKDMYTLFFNLRRKVKSFRPQVIHSQYATMTGMVTILASEGIPTVVSFGGDEVYGTYKDENSTLSLRTWSARLCSIYCARYAHVSVVKNARMAKIVRGWGSQSIEDIPNGVNLDLFKPLNWQKCRKALGLAVSARYIIFAIRGNDYVKRRDLAETAIQRYNHRYHANAELLILEKVSPDKMPLYLNAGDVLLTCSNHEGSPNIVKEALACNRPVVATDIGDIRQRFGQVKGLFLSMHDPEMIADCLSEALQIGYSNGREYLADLTEQAVAQRLVSLYQAL